MLQETSAQFTPISHLGEFGLIQRLVRGFALKPDTQVLKGVGDDCAVIRHGDECLLLSTDTLAQNVHFDLAYTPLRHLGYKAAVVNFSDVHAMNALPQYLTIALALDARMSVEAVEELYAGVRLACERYGVELVGGDTTSSRSGLVLTLSVFGFQKPEKVAYRRGAQARDLICLSGSLGGAFAGLQILEREKAVYLANPEIQPDLSEHAYVVERQLKPETPQHLIQRLDELGILPTSMIDISDGLASELHHICKASGLGARIFQDKLPIDYETTKVSELLNIPQTTMALHGGEDYELLFTLPIALHDKVQQLQDVAIIGFIQGAGEPIQLQTSDGSLVDIPFQGYQHFHKS